MKQTNLVFLSVSDEISHSNSYNLTFNFISSNPTWALDSLYMYAVREYTKFGFTKAIFSDAVREYVNSKPF